MKRYNLPVKTSAINALAEDVVIIKTMIIQKTQTSTSSFKCLTPFF